MQTSQIVCHPDSPAVFHSEFDNFDQLVNDLSGKGSVHTAHGIMLQDFETDSTNRPSGTVPDIPSIERTKKRNLKFEAPETLPDCFITKRQSPSLQIKRWVYAGADEISHDIIHQNLLWILIRLHSSQRGQQVPSWTGFVSVINQPITDYKTVQECLRFAEEATGEVGQKYVKTTFDLGVCMKAYPILWNWPERYSNHIVLLGSFHLACAFMNMIGKKMAGSGWTDFLLEADLVGSGSVHGVITGKHYERAMHCHKNMLEALERLLIEQFCLNLGVENIFDSLTLEAKEKLEGLIQSPSEQNMKSSRR